jgi:hypothetical protein
LGWVNRQLSCNLLLATKHNQLVLSLSHTFTTTTTILHFLLVISPQQYITTIPKGLETYLKQILNENASCFHFNDEATSCSWWGDIED